MACRSQRHPYHPREAPSWHRLLDWCYFVQKQTEGVTGFELKYMMSARLLFLPQQMCPSKSANHRVELLCLMLTMLALWLAITTPGHVWIGFKGQKMKEADADDARQLAESIQSLGRTVVLAASSKAEGEFAKNDG